MADKKIDFNALQQVIDTSWGHSSTPNVATYSVKFSLQNVDHLQVMFSTTVQIYGLQDKIRTQRRCAEESTSIINDALAVVKTAYKELTGDAIKLIVASSAESFDVVGGFGGMKNPKMSALYRRKSILEIG